MNPQARFLDYSAALLIFPGLWLVGLSLLFQVENAIGIDLMPSLILRFALGFFCYAAAWVTVSHRGVRYGDRGLTLFLHILQHVVAAVLIVAVTFYFAEFYWAFAEPIGANTDSGIGPCKREELSSKPNGRGLIANLRRTTCMGGWDEVPEYFVFVHKSSEENSSSNLVLRYDAGPPYYLRPPHLQWLSPAHLKISSHDTALWITREEQSIEGIAVTYAIAADCPSSLTAWDRLKFNWYLYNTCR